MIYYISRHQDVHSAAAKAPNDISTLCKRQGWTELRYPVKLKKESKFGFRVRRSIMVPFFWLAALFRIHTGDIVIYQHPVNFGNKIAYCFIKLLQQKKVRFIALIHDLDSLRFELLWSDNAKANIGFKDGIFLQQFDIVICHNEFMKDHLISKGFPAHKLISLELFDYLLPTVETPIPTNTDGLVIAGNLLPKKSGYIYELAKLTGFHIHLYGMNYCDGSELGNVLLYHGSYSPDELPLILEGKYGIVWDGNSIDTCEGAAGNYLRYNNPHKLSLFMAAGIPVITWRDAAIADFVNKYGVGISVDSLREIPERLSQITDSQYLQMQTHVKSIQHKVCNGEYFYQAINTAIKIIHQEQI